MSDKQKGLIQAFLAVFSNSAHRFCVRHLHNNMKTAGFRGLAYKNALWKAARASTVGEFKLRMEEIKALDQAAFDWLHDKPAQEWSKSHFTELPKCDMLLNNCCESFNANILDARDKPVLTLLEWIREYLMKRLQENRDKTARKWKGILCPKIKKIVQKNVDKIGDCIPIKSNDRHYQISCYDGSQYSVDLERRTCTCRIWQLSGIPCKHACSAIFHQNLMPEDMVHPYYTVAAYKGPGKPAGARRREPDEQPVKNKKRKGKKAVKQVKLKRQHVSHHCRICGEAGHNAKGCALWKDMDAPGLENIPAEVFSLQGHKRGGSKGIPKPKKHSVYVDKQKMAHNNRSMQPPVTLQQRLSIRAPPPMTGTAFMPSFSTRPAIPIPKNIIKMGGQKFVNLSTWPSSQTDGDARNT
ncbi:UNVERIFIED_CONTAM: hypothetical protein Sradi_3094900 [Sesamum radiatum]|uniref:SWIM-type domain-containing protein n=1 Tax=Sesamum radiatum TaxID=300843 RepID=A0AAW2RD25_SESRA